MKFVTFTEDNHMRIGVLRDGSLTGAYDPIYAPPESAQLDYEAELAIVIGRRCRRVPKDRAMEVVAGAMGANKNPHPLSSCNGVCAV